MASEFGNSFLKFSRVDLTETPTRSGMGSVSLLNKSFMTEATRSVRNLIQELQSTCNEDSFNTREPIVTRFSLDRLL